MKIIKQFTIDRKKWARGREKVNKLLKNDGTMCCLGFYAKACGLNDEQILHTGAPHQLLVPLPRQMAWLVDEANCDATTDASDLIFANDSMLRDGPRERKIIKIFAQKGIEVTFKG